MIKNIITLLALFFVSKTLWAYGTGISTHPLLVDKKLITGEVTGITSSGGGAGIQGRYTQKVSPKLTVDAGMGFSGGERTGRLFAGADYEIFPDYQNQPRVSTRVSFANAKEYSTRNNILTFAPTVSKGFSVTGREIFPFVSVPFGLSLDSDTKTYETTFSLNLGASGQVPIEGYRHLTASIEGIVGVSDSYSGVFLGLSYPIN